MRFQPFLSAAIGTLLSLLLMACSSQPMPQGPTVAVERVISGNTLEVFSSTDATVQQIRLQGIDAPDLQQTPWGPAAKQRLTELIGDRAIQLELQNDVPDRYGRWWAMIWCDKILLNERMVAEGHALVSESPLPHYRDHLIRAQERARLMGLGIWNPAHPLRQTPQEFRAQKQRSEADATNASIFR